MLPPRNEPAEVAGQVLRIGWFLCRPCGMWRAVFIDGRYRSKQVQWPGGGCLSAGRMPGVHWQIGCATEAAQGGNRGNSIRGCHAADRSSKLETALEKAARGRYGRYRKSGGPHLARPSPHCRWQPQIASDRICRRGHMVDKIARLAGSLPTRAVPRQ